MRFTPLPYVLCCTPTASTQITCLYKLMFSSGAAKSPADRSELDGTFQHRVTSCYSGERTKQGSHICISTQARSGECDLATPYTITTTNFLFTSWSSKHSSPRLGQWDLPGSLPERLERQAVARLAALLHYVQYHSVKQHHVQYESVRPYFATSLPRHTVPVCVRDGAPCVPDFRSLTASRGCIFHSTIKYCWLYQQYIGHCHETHI
jgi:hypothetical protein